MTTPLSENLEKCKVKNQLEQRQHQRVLGDLVTSQRSCLHKMDRERLALLQQLQINRCKSMRSSLKQDMKFKDRLTLMRHDIKAVPQREQPSLFERSKGFSKVAIQEDEDDLNIYLSLRRSKSTHVSKVLQHAYNFMLTDDDVYVHYPIPTPDNGLGKTKTIVTISEVKAFKSQRNETEKTLNINLKSNTSTGQKPKAKCKQRPHSFSAVASSRNPKPSYVNKLESLSVQNFDQFTDGTMHLEERRFQQRQRESMLPQIGHLPVRQRYFSDKSDLLATQISMNSCVINNVTALPAKNIKIYLPKSARMNKEAEDNVEQKRFLKLKQEHQAQEYTKVMAMTGRFLGRKPRFIHLIQRQRLEREEYVMLEQMRRKVPSFKTAATIVKWLAKPKTDSTSRDKEVEFKDKA